MDKSSDQIPKGKQSLGSIIKGDNKDIRKVKKRQGHYPEFGHTQGEIQKTNLQKSTLGITL